MILENTPVLYIAFARPEYARQSFDAIKAVKPKKFYFYSNKGREGHGDELERNETVRAMLKEVDWDCELHTWFREECVDVYASLYGAINWFFDHEEKGIVIEEDCVAAPAFFDFVEKMLLKYKDDQRVWMVGGSNYIEGYNPHGYDYHFSHNMFIHGWGSWRDRWNQIEWDNFSVDSIIEHNVLDAVFDTPKQRKFHSKRLKSYSEFIKKTHCWDLIFTTTGRTKGALGILPSHHLVENVGLEGVHARPSDKSIANNIITYTKCTYNINKEPPFVVADVLFDDKLFYELHLKPTLLRFRILRKLKKILGLK